MSTNVTDGLGVRPLWSLSCALDLQDPRGTACVESFENRAAQESKAVKSVSATAQDFKALLLAPGDICHVLRTVACAHRWSQRPVELHVFEEFPEATARMLLFLSFAVDQSRTPEEIAQLILEVHGNTLLREKTQEYITERVTVVLRLLTDNDGPLASMIDLSNLKFKERDEIEDTLRRFLTPKKPDQLDIKELRDYRLRGLFADRYDSRENLIDWDYYMLLKDNLSIIPFSQYKRWRLTGLAFELRECAYTVPNRTLITTRIGNEKQKGVVQVRGLWSDVICSPYLGYGMQSEDASLFETRNKQYYKSVVDICEFNLSSDIHEMRTGKPLQRINRKSNYADTAPPTLNTKSKDAKSEEETKATANSEAPADTTQTEASAVAEAKVPFKIILYTGDVARSVLGKAQLKGAFHRIHLSQSQLHRVKEDLAVVAADGCLLSIDSVKYVPLKEEQRAAYNSKMTEMVAAFGFKSTQLGNGKGSTALTHAPTSVPHLFFEKKA